MNSGQHSVLYLRWVHLPNLLTCGGQNAFLIFVLTSASLSSMKMALLGSLLLIFS